VGLFDLRAARRSTTRCSALDVDLFDCALLGCDVCLLDGALPALYVDLFDCALLGARRGLIRLRAARRSTARCSALDVGLFDSALLGARRPAARLQPVSLFVYVYFLFCLFFCLNKK
jgi:hypothetical protein